MIAKILMQNIVEATQKKQNRYLWELASFKLLRLLEKNIIDYCGAARYWYRFSQSDEWCKAIKGNFERITSNSRYASCSMVPRVLKNCRRQWYRDSYDEVVGDKYYKKSVSITFLDDLITELDTRFSSDAVTFYNDFFSTCCYVFKWPKELWLWYWIYSEKKCYDLFEISRRLASAKRNLICGTENRNL